MNYNQLFTPRLTEQGAFRDVSQRRSGLYLPAGLKLPAERPTVIDLFAGAGGFSLGFLAAGFEVVAAVENDVSAASTYWYNLAGPSSRWISSPEKRKKRDKILRSGAFNELAGEYPPVRVLVCDDVQSVTGDRLLSLAEVKPGDLDCVIGGPPCQGFSYSGRRDVHDPRNSLVWEFARLVHELKPKTFVMENVPGIANMTTPSGLPVLQALIRAFEDEGFLAVTQKVDEAVKRAKKEAAVSGMRQKPPTVELNGEPAQLALF